MIVIINTGIANVGSVQSALNKINKKNRLINKPDQLHGASHIILPGVGSFFYGMNFLNTYGWSEEIINAVIKENIPILGICLGMQMLASYGIEGGKIAGLDLIPGTITHLKSIGCTKRLPHIGWNDIIIQNQNCPLISGIPQNSDFYFINTYTFLPKNEGHIAATTDYGIPFTSIVGEGSIWGTQFHPEKSSKAGLYLLKNFSEL